MMKKISALTLILTILSCTCFSFSGYAYAKTKPILQIEIVDVEYLDNGDCIETVLITSGSNSADASITASVKTGSKTKSYKNSNGNVLWSVTVKGTFSYSGNSATCISASRSTSAPGSAWTIKSSSVSKSGNTATAKATATYSVASVTQDISMSVSLSCSANGTLS